MGRTKSERYQAVKNFPNYFDFESAPKYRWNELAFKNENELVLELGCGNGEYVVSLAQKYPDKNFIGIDLKSERLFKGLTKAEELGLKNAAFLRTEIQFLSDYFSKDEVDELWITFPDPFLKGQKQNKRLTSDFFLQIYRGVLKNNGLIHFKTDSDVLFEYTLEILDQEENVQILYKTFDLFKDKHAPEEWLIKTKFETKYHALGIPTKFLKFRLGNEGKKGIKV